jgi:hypothetical protein
MRRVRVLTPVFFGRFFDNEMASGAGSLKTPFFWLVAFLAAPGVFMPILMSSEWSFVSRYYGLAQLDIIVRADKVIYLAYSGFAAGIVITMAWNALLLDRRDGLVLGAQPVGARDVIVAKILALAGYVGLLIVAMNAAASLMFGLFLIDARGPGSVFGSTLAHFVASSAYGLFICLAMVALQGVALALAGGRAFVKISPILQLVITAVVLTSFFFIGDTANATIDTLAGTGPHVASWILRTPTMWFLGLYEVMLGFREPVLVTLGWRAITALGIVVAITAVALPLSYRRVMIAAVEQTGRSRRASFVSAAAHAIARLITRPGETRALADFFLVSIIRHNRPRLAVAIAVGATIAWSGPVLAVELAHGVTTVPAAPLLGTSLAAIALLVAGFRVAASLPSELPPRWVFAVHGVSDKASRAATARVAFALGVVLPTAISAIALGKWWGPLVLPHAALCLSTGLLTVELAFSRFDGMPCARPLNAEGANLRAWWPAYLGGFVFVSSGLPWIELHFRQNPPAMWAFVVSPLAAAAVWRVASRFITREPPADEDDLPHVQVLDL